MASLKLTVKGMHCGSCEVLIKDTLLELSGVKRVAVDHKTGALTVEGDKLDKKSIAVAVKAEGYEVA